MKWRLRYSEQMRTAARGVGYVLAVLAVAGIAVGLMTLFERTAVSSQERAGLRADVAEVEKEKARQDLAIQLLQDQIEDSGDVPVVPDTPNRTDANAPLIVVPTVPTSRLARAINDYCADGGCGEDGKDGEDGQMPSLAQLSSLTQQAVAAYCSVRNDCTPPAPPAGKDGATGNRGPAGVGLQRLACVDGELVAFLTDGTSDTVEGGSLACPPVAPPPDPEPTPDPTTTPAS